VRTILHVAPHPDDESIGSPCTLLRLAARGARVVVVACGLGRPADHERRRRELVAATRYADLDLLIREPPTALASDDDLDAAQRELLPWIAHLIDSSRADLVLSPHLHDAHPAHEAVARAVRDAVTAARQPPVWWSWGIWAEPRRPTLLVPCAPEDVERALGMLGHHRGELARNDYVAMVRAAGRLAAVRGVERVCGFGARALVGVDHAELLTELGYVDGAWRFGQPRLAAELDLPVRWGPDASAFVAGP
jgi:LmbE family N-acetylglucosaminyl deacetylase